MSAPMLAAATGAILLAMVGAAVPHRDGDKPVRSLTHCLDERPARIAPAMAVSFAAAPVDEPRDGCGAPRSGGSIPTPMVVSEAHANVWKMKG